MLYRRMMMAMMGEDAAPSEWTDITSSFDGSAPYVSQQTFEAFFRLEISSAVIYAGDVIRLTVTRASTVPVTFGLSWQGAGSDGSIDIQDTVTNLYMINTDGYASGGDYIDHIDVSTTQAIEFQVTKIEKYSGSGDPFDPFLLLDIGSNTFDGDTSIIDSSSNSWVITPDGTMAHSTTQFQTSSSSIRSISPGGGAGIPDDPAFDFLFRDFTFEWWEYMVVNSSNGTTFTVNDGPASAGMSLAIGFNAGTHAVYASSNGSGYDIASAETIGTVNIGQWDHLAVTRENGTWRTYQNGTKVNEWYSAGSIYVQPTSYRQGFCSWGGGSYVKDSYIDDFKLYADVAKYTGDSFTLP